MVRRLIFSLSVSTGVLMSAPGVASACGGLVAPGHAEVLEKATTLSAWHGGFEHYVTGFRFAGSADRFGYIIPLPGVPVRIQKGGGWTLERLEREVSPIFSQALAAEAFPAPKAAVQVLQQVKIDALDISVVRGGGRDVAAWAGRNGFDLTPDSPTVLDRYASHGAVFALARFDRADAVRRGLVEGQGETVHFTIPTRAPWIPLDILALGKGRTELVDADLFVLTDDRPSLAPDPSGVPGMTVRASRAAPASLLADLRSDRGMAWLPAGGMWFTALSLRTVAGSIDRDLSIDGGGPVGLLTPSVDRSPAWASSLTVLVIALGAVTLWMLWRTPQARPRAA